MDLERKNRYEQLYNIKLQDLYTFVTEVMRDFSYSLIRTVKDVENFRRIELWAYQGKEEQAALVWVEVVKPGDALDIYFATDVLRTMNDENVTRLFFFTNGHMEPDDKETLEGTNHFVFGTDEIVETLLTIDKKRAVRVVRKRKKVNVPSAVILIKNFLRANIRKRITIRLKTSAIPELTDQYYRIVRKVLAEADKIKDLNEIPVDVREKLKKIQYELLPELVKTPSYVFNHKFTHLRNTLFSLMEYTIVYIGNIIEYEAEDDLKRNRERIEDLLEKLNNISEEVANYKEDMMFYSEKLSLKVIMYSAFFILIGLFIMVVVRFT